MPDNTALKDVIPEEFYRGDKIRPQSNTVGDLVDQLSRLPRELPLCNTKVVVVYNINQWPVVEVDESDD